MEDRLSAGLYMELLDAAPSDGMGHASDLVALPGVARVSWWANQRVGRDELPMKVPDGALLVIAEVTDRFRPPPAPTAGTGVHFQRYPRPNQGALSGTTSGLLVVWISPKRPELAGPLRDWADFVHIRHIAEAGVPGYTTITPYENASRGEPRFMHLYEMETDDPEAAYQLMPKLVAERLTGDAFQVWADWRRAGGHIVYCNTFKRAGELVRR